MRTHLTEVAVSTNPIVEDLDIVEHVRPGLLARPIDPSSDPFHLQTAEEGFRYGIIETVAPATHAGNQPVAPEKPHRVVASVLRPLIGMDDHRLLRATSPNRHQQGIQDPDISDVRGPHTIGGRRRKVLLQPIRSNQRGFAGPVSGLLVSTDRPQAVHSQETGDFMFAAILSVFPKVAMDPRAAVNPIAGLLERPDLPHKPLVLDRPPRLRGLHPRAEPAPVHPQDPAHRRQAKLATVSRHERVPRPGDPHYYPNRCLQNQGKSSHRDHIPQYPS